MSKYERYDTTCADYDGTRVPIGVEILLGCLASGRKPLSDMAVLDAGCGTGSYALAVVDKVGRVDLLDISDGMLSRARAKLADRAADGRAAFHNGRIDAMPFADESFDAVMFNQVLHHLADGADSTFAWLSAPFAEAARVVRPGGRVVVNITSPIQIVDGFWYHDLIPDAIDAMIRIHPPLDVLEQYLRGCELHPTGRFVPVGEVLQGDAYFNPRGPLDPAWRAGDSIWAKVAPADLAAVEARVHEMDGAGTLDTYWAAHDAKRETVGQTTFVSARKSR